MIPTSFWAPPTGRELDTTPLPATVTPTRLVACLNVWNDFGALQRTFAAWAPYVDRILAVDGAYGTIDGGLSTDGTREFLLQSSKVTLLDCAGVSQCEKRSVYLDAGQPGDYLFIIDADEMVLNPHALRAMPTGDVMWVRIHSKLYAKPYGQPRILRWMPGLRYQGRHHWIFQNDRLVCTHQYGGPGYAHRTMPLILDNQRHIGRSASRLHAKREHAPKQFGVERVLVATPRSVMSDSQTTARESLQIMHIAYRDDGIAPSRLHTAINRTTPHASLFFKTREGPFGVPTQYSVRDANATRIALGNANVVHFHGVMSTAYRMRPNIPLVFHHHGTLYRNNFIEYNAQAKRLGALVLLSNLELFSWTDGLDAAFFLPNVVPVARYRALHDASVVPFTGETPFRVAHSPSKPERKGTAAFLAACDRLRQSGLPIEPVMIQNETHANSLRVKATCHAAFDSFWLGLQCSGLECAAMGLPVIAGDATVAQRYRERFGEVPYTLAETPEALEDALRRLVEDAAFRHQEAARVEAYVIAHHDESAVALTYLDYLDQAFGWRSKPTHTRFPTTRPRAVGGRR